MTFAESASTEKKENFFEGDPLDCWIFGSHKNSCISAVYKYFKEILDATERGEHALENASNDIKNW